MRGLSYLNFFSSLTILLFSTGIASARPAHKQAFAGYMGTFLPKKLNDCRTCHMPEGADEERPHNVFGTRLKEVRKELAKAGKPSDLVACLDVVAEEDTDGDGVSNLVEWLTGRFPGEKDDTPSADERTSAKELQKAFQKMRASYQWKPFEIVKQPPAPVIKEPTRSKNPIDSFLLAELDAKGIKPNPEASKTVLVRRLYLDLIGLPPTPAELEAALADTSAKWYETLVDKLLENPKYGERWARHWMDIWRYCDNWGYNNEIRHSQPHVWRWRDWIVESLNENKGYDRMILEMLAGDELAPDDPKIVRATGYLVRNFDLYGREKWLQDTVEHTFQGFLGVTIGCARCHDHMYDPISQREYYQVRAFFEPHHVRLDHMPGNPDRLKNGLARAFDATPNAPTHFLKRGDPMTPDKSATIPPGVPKLLGGRLPEITPVQLPPSVYDPENRDFVIREMILAAEQEVTKAKEARAKAETPLPKMTAEEHDVLKEGATLDISVMESRLASLIATHKATKLEVEGKKDTADWKTAAIEANKAQRRLTVVETKKKLFVTRQNIIKFNKNGSEASRKYFADEEAKVLKTLATAEETEKKEPTTEYVKRPVKSYPQESTGRRTAFAKWLVDKENPLTARVAVNHLWLRHFGQALVPSVTEFGRNGRPPANPALVDWLASEFMKSGWDMKAMHRLMLTSSAYRQSSVTDSAKAKLDPDNVLFWRMPQKRMEAEVVRDSILYVAGKLDVTFGGPEIDHLQGLFVPRRSLYFRHAEDLQVEFLKIFDAASPNECYERTTSVSPQQALALANSDLTIRNSRILARAIAAKHNKDSEEFVRAAFVAVLSRQPTDEERSECQNFLEQQAKLYGPNRNPAAMPDEKLPAADPNIRARENLVRLLFNHHDFTTIR